MLNKLILSVFLICACSDEVFSQGFPMPGPEHKRLTELEGTWDAVMDFEGNKSKASAIYKSICGGMWVQSDFHGDLGGIKFHGHGLDGYDLTKKKYVGVWVDSLTSSSMTFEGDFDPKTKQLVMTGESTGPDGKPQKFKNVTETKDKDHFTFKMFMVDATGNEKLAFAIDYTRRKPEGAK